MAQGAVRAVSTFSLPRARAGIVARRRGAARVCRVRCGLDGKTGVLFVCLGNICRSPAGEAVFRAVCERRGVAGRFDIDSCGTGGGSDNWCLPGGISYHEGDDADRRMTSAASKRKVSLTSKSRPLRPEDFDRFEHILAMDGSNIVQIERAAAQWGVTPRDGQVRLTLGGDVLSDPRFKGRYTACPDPYYGGADGFELVLDLLEDACEGIIDQFLGE